MSSSRERLGLLLPLPALLIAGPAHARAPGSSPPSEDPAAFEPPPDPGPGEDRPAEDDPFAAEQRLRARELYERGREAFLREEYREAGMAFEESAALSLGLLELHRQAAIAFRHAALDERDPGPAAELCEATRRNARAVITHPQATPAQVEEAQAEQAQADAHCKALAEADLGACLSPIRCLQPEFGPCLSIIEPSRGCGHRRDGAVAMLGTLALLGLRSRRRRDAVERLADRLPPDVLARLRRNDDDEPGGGDR